MKVLMTADAVGGVWTYALDLARGLAREGLETVLAVMGPDLDDAKASEAATVPGLALTQTGLPLDWLAEDAGAVAQAGRRIADLARTHDVDLVHLNSPALAGDAVFRQPVVGVCHSCVATWWEAARRGSLPDDFRWRKDLVRHGYTACGALIAPTQAFADATATAYGLDAAPFAVHNGRGQIAAVSPTGPGRTDERPFVLTAGRLWDDGKNVATLDRAAARIDVPVRAAGPTRGPNGTEIRLGSIEPLGTLATGGMAEILSATPIFASLARYEPFGLAVLEAAQAGCALVLSDIATFRELWDGAALFVPADDDASAADVMSRLAADPVERTARGAAARARAARYTVDAMTAGTLDVYRRVLAGRTAVAA